MTRTAQDLREATDFDFCLWWGEIGPDQRQAFPAQERTEFFARAKALSPGWKGNGKSNGDAERGRAWADAETERRAGAFEEPELPDHQMMDWNGLSMREPPPMDWIMKEWLSWSPTLLAGRGGIGKSLMIQTVLTQLACGLPTWCEAVDPLRVLYWACEDEHDHLWRRQNLICKSLKIGFDGLQNLHMDARCGLENTLMSVSFGRPDWTPTLEKLRQQVNDLEIDVLALDNVGHAFGGNENARHEVTVFINRICGLVRGRRFCPILLGHPAKIKDSEFSGSTAWEAACRMRWFMADKLPDAHATEDETPDSDMRIVAKRKTNYTVADFQKFHFANGVLVPEIREHADPGIMDSIRRRRAQTIVVQAIEKLTKMGVVVSNSTGKNYMPSIAAQHKLMEGFTKRELGEAMIALMNDGKLVRGTCGLDDSRHEKIGLKLSYS